MNEASNKSIPRPVRLFISRPAEELELLPEFCSYNNILLSAHSFLSFEDVSFQLERNYDIVFFASPRAARFFLNRVDCSQKLIAVAGETTKKFIEKQGLAVHFSPANSGAIEESASEFAQWTNGRNVLFPTSDISHRSYTKRLDVEQFHSVQVYKTQISTQKTEFCDVYVFTSPSNLRGFLESNTIPHTAIVIAWGETTHQALTPHIERQRLFILKQSSEEALIGLIPRIYSDTFR